LVKNQYFYLIFIFLLNFYSCHHQQLSTDQQIVYWSSNNTYEIEFSRAVVQDWNKLHPDQVVKFQPVPEGQSSEEVILAAVVGKTTPDIYSNMWQGDVEAYADAGVLIPLDTLPGFMSFLVQRCDSQTIAEVTSLDGHVYQIPWKINPIMLIYNVNLLEEIGYNKPPRTYSDFLEAGEKFKKDIDGDGYVDRWIGYSEVMVRWWQRFFDFYPLYLAASHGASLVEGNQIIFDNSYAVNVFKFLKTIYEKDYFSKERLSARQDVFLSGVIATRFTGPWEIMHAEHFKPEGFKYEFSPMPVPDDFQGEPYTYCDPKNIVIFNSCKNPKRAWEFLKLLTSRENDLRFLEMTNELPRRQNLVEDNLFQNYFKQNPKMRPFAKQAKFVKGTDKSPVLKEIFDIISQEYEACVVYNKKSPEQAISDASKAARLIVH
jgi:multiple sugar transport system substrate-binding protein